MTTFDGQNAHLFQLEFIDSYVRKMYTDRVIKNSRDNAFEQAENLTSTVSHEMRTPHGCIMHNAARIFKLGNS